MTDPVLIGCSHGTNDAAGRAVVRGLLDDVRAARPGMDVREAFVDVQEPGVDDVVAGVLSSGRRAVVVPLLLSGGYHTNVDIARAVSSGTGRAVAARPLGPDERLADLLLRRLADAGVSPDAAVVLAAAGSSDSRATDDVEALASVVRDRRPGAVEIGYGSSAAPAVPVAVESLRASGFREVAVAAYLLAPGFFHDRLKVAGADVVTAPLAPDPVLADIVLDRFDEAAPRLR